MLKSACCVLALTLAGGLHAAPVTPPATRIDPALQADLQHLADKARPGHLGIVVREQGAGIVGQVNAADRYMLMSTFKAPVAAAVFSQVDAGKLSLDQKVRVTPADVLGGSAVPSIGVRAAKGPIEVTLNELLQAAVTQSDNTSVDVLLHLAGGGTFVTGFLEGKGVHGLRVDVGEREIGQLFEGLKPGETVPAGESDAQGDAREKRGYAMALASPLNTSTPVAATVFLEKLQAGELVSADSTRRLLDMMKAQVIPNRIRAGLPQGVEFADKTGTGSSNGGHISAYNDIGIATAANGRRVFVAAFLRDSAATGPERDAMYAELGKIIGRHLQAGSAPAATPATH